ncbi:unnamed protein product [Nippostrongylus brasiliensis]|uniref:Prophage protein n=1 Tax=Nippostrongylus brasiliensis TaxID=27835 RepID=A0A0N4YRD3_NIPBR|nr:unnamed protein product [Nippostrongylus brasiliensis]
MNYALSAIASGMTTATVTYHKLPPLTGWTGGEANHPAGHPMGTAQPASIQNGYVRQDIGGESVSKSLQQKAITTATNK